MMKTILFALVLSQSLVRASEPESVTRQLARPVLIRNEHNTLLRLTVNAGEKPFVQVKSVTVLLKRASDLESLQFGDVKNQLQHIRLARISLGVL